ncbi:MAG: hypothetical protein ACI8P0_001033 [Planctomycetaceae bacterium]|jgi:hypothetical protein
MNRGPDTTFSPAEEFERLDALGILPPASDLATYSSAESAAKGLLAVWQKWLRQAPKNRRSRAAGIHSGLFAAVENGAELTFTVPGRDRLVCESWLGQRAYWWPRGAPCSRRVGIVGSRLKRDPTLQAPVLRALRLSMTAIDKSSEQVVASAGTSLYDYVEQCATTFDVPLLRVSTPPDQGSSKLWLDELIRNPGPMCDFELSLSPSVSPTGSAASPSADSVLATLEQLPIRDRILALMSDRLFVLTLRRRGNWWKLLQLGFQNGLWDVGAVRAVVGQGLCSEDVASELQDREAVSWYLVADDCLTRNRDQQLSREQSKSDLRVSVASSERQAAEDALITELVAAEPTSEWLLHWTRAPRNEWPGESGDDHLSSSVLSEEEVVRTAFGTLQRIVDEGVVRATSGNTRATVDVVCLADVPLVTLLAKRVFRSHRGRWDFEHYGIGVRKQRVWSLGGRPVIYGDESVWQTLPEGERPWFQLQQSQSDSNPIDWTVENEWRLTSELKLGNVPADDVFVFCRTEDEAEMLRAAYDWRVVSVETLRSRSHE